MAAVLMRSQVPVSYVTEVMVVIKDDDLGECGGCDCREQVLEERDDGVSCDRRCWDPECPKRLEP